MTVTLTDNLSTPGKTSGCPAWCVNDHVGDSIMLEQFNRVEHFGHVQEIPGDGFGEADVVAHVELYCFERPNGERSDIGVTTWCESTITKEQARVYAGLLLTASNPARSLVVRSEA